MVNAGANAKPKKLIHRILLTGGPCAGKSTALSTIQQFLLNRGYTVYTIPEASTLLQLQGGLKVSGTTLPYFQVMVTKIQYDLESLYYDYAKNTLSMHSDNPTVILIDRGVMDGNAYVTDKNEFNKILSLSMNIKNDVGPIDTNKLMNDKYDMILHLVTAANGAEEYYQNALYRHETVEVAKELDNRLIDVYQNHNDRRICYNLGSFDDKMKSIISHISDKLELQTFAQNELRFTATMKDNNFDIQHIINSLKHYVSLDNDNKIIATHVTKYFLQQKDKNKVKNDDDDKSGYSFIRETSTLNIYDNQLSINEQVDDIYKMSEVLLSSHTIDIDEKMTLGIPETAGAAWIDASHYMLLRLRWDQGQFINESEKLTKIRYEEHRRLYRDFNKEKIEKFKFFFYYKQQFYALDMFIKPESHKNNMWLKVYRTPGSKYTKNVPLSEIEAPPCIELKQNVTDDPKQSSYVYSDDKK